MIINIFKTYGTFFSRFSFGNQLLSVATIFLSISKSLLSVFAPYTIAVFAKAVAQDENEAPLFPDLFNNALNLTKLELIYTYVGMRSTNLILQSITDHMTDRLQISGLNILIEEVANKTTELSVQDIKIFDLNHRGVRQNIKRLMNDGSDSYQAITVGLIPNTFEVIVAIILVYFEIGEPESGVFLAYAVLSLLLDYFISKYAVDTTRINVLADKMVRYYAETITNLETIKVNSASEYQKQKLITTWESFKEVQGSGSKFVFFKNFTKDTLAACAIATYVSVVILVDELDREDIDEFVFLVAYVFQFSSLLTTISSQTLGLAKKMNEFLYIRDFLQLTPTKGPIVLTENDMLKSAEVVSLKDCSLTVGNKKILDNVTLSIPAGNENHLALVGESGSGKTTILRLLLGFKPISPNNAPVTLSNPVLVFGKAIDSLDLETLYPYIGWIPQHVDVLGGHLKFNVLLSLYGEKYFAAKNETHCDFLLMSTPPEKDTWDKLNIAANSAYIKSGNQLFYVNKGKQEFREITLSANAQKQLNSKITRSMAMDQSRTLSQEELRILKSITKHDPEISETKTLVKYKEFYNQLVDPLHEEKIFLQAALRAQLYELLKSYYKAIATTYIQKSIINPANKIKNKCFNALPIKFVTPLVWQEITSDALLYAEFIKEIINEYKITPASVMVLPICILGPLDEPAKTPEVRRKPAIHPELILKKVAGDGHCLFHALGLALNLNQKQLRAAAAHELETKTDHYKHYFANNEKSLLDYIKDIRNGKEWADHVTINAIMNVYHRPIIVVYSDGEVRNLDDNNLYEMHEPLFVYYNGSHYDALLPSERYKDRGKELLALMMSAKNNSPRPLPKAPSQSQNNIIKINRTWAALVISTFHSNIEAQAEKIEDGEAKEQNKIILFWDGDVIKLPSSLKIAKKNISEGKTEEHHFYLYHSKLESLSHDPNSPISYELLQLLITIKNYIYKTFLEQDKHCLPCSERKIKKRYGFYLKPDHNVAENCIKQAELVINKFLTADDMESLNLPTVSGGEEQRIGAARFFAKKLTKLSLFDEPTSALDAFTEARLLDEYEKENTEKPVLSISHRLFTIKDSSQIKYIENGCIDPNESGTHDELTSKDTKYKRAWHLQIGKHI